MATAPKGVLKDWSYRLTPEDIKHRTQELITEWRTVYDRVGATSETDVGVENVLKALQELDRSERVHGRHLEFAQHAHPDELIRKASVEADKLISEFEVDMSMHQGVFNSLLALERKNLHLDPEEKRYLDKLIKLGKRNGLHLPENTQAEIKVLKKRISEICIDFMKNLNEVKTYLEFSEEELKGLPEDFITNLDKAESGKRKVTLKYPHYFPIMRKAQNPETRKRLEQSFNSQCIPENVLILEELVRIRHKCALLLGYKNHANYKVELLMSKSEETVNSFLTGLEEKLRDAWAKEKEVLLKLKEEECAKLSIPFDNRLNAYDLSYYTTMVEEKLFSVDQEQLKQYFPIDTVIKGLFDIYQELLSLRFEEIENPPVWHPEVKMFSVSDKESGDLRGYFFMDLYPREGKYGHAAVFDMQPMCVNENGEQQIVIAALVTNFTKATSEKPSLLDHKEVETFFHEFGHVMHHQCSTVKLARFSGTAVERDFVEAPSQMLENWCWAEEPLLRMSGHYKDGSRIPADVLQSLIKSQLANVAHFNIRQLTLGLFDQAIHTRPEADTAKIFSEISVKISGIPPSPNTNFASHFAHIGSTGYDALYYSYMWSEVYSMDMFQSRFKKEGLFNPAVGLDYRNKILAKGGSVDAIDMVRDFLGREPNEEAFLISKGLVPS